MTTDEFKKAIQEKRMDLGDSAGHICKTSRNGPIGIDMMDLTLAAMEALENRIAELEAKSQ
jgi:hypothetical protein